jgi:hypothetical protein
LLKILEFWSAIWALFECGARFTRRFRKDVGPRKSKQDWVKASTTQSSTLVSLCKPFTYRVFEGTVFEWPAGNGGMVFSIRHDRSVREPFAHRLTFGLLDDTQKGRLWANGSSVMFA